MSTKSAGFHPAHYLCAWAVHVFTASAGWFGLLTLAYIYQHQYINAFWCMGIAVVIDAVDGSLARLVHVKSVLPKIDGTLLDNIVDFLNYVITPCFVLYVNSEMLPDALRMPLIAAIIIASLYQFCQADAKTPDHFFKGFPCYWNIAVFYLFLFSTSTMTNLYVLMLLVVLIFIPIKYVYPSRLDYLTRSIFLKVIMHLLSLTYGVATGLILWMYPRVPSTLLFISLAYGILYVFLSLYRTFNPMQRQRDKTASQ